MCKPSRIWLVAAFLPLILIGCSSVAVEDVPLAESWTVVEAERSELPPGPDDNVRVFQVPPGTTWDDVSSYFETALDESWRLQASSTTAARRLLLVNDSGWSASAVLVYPSPQAGRRRYVIQVDSTNS